VPQDLLYLDTESDEQIAAVHIRRGIRGTDRVILYSHGNAEDLGQRLHLDIMEIGGKIAGLACKILVPKLT